MSQGVGAANQAMENQLTSIGAVDLGIADYSEVFDLQQRIVAAKVTDPALPDVILILEHPAVFTLGKRGGRDNISVSESWLSIREIDVVQTQRGGNITFHGPGQLVMYPILDLNRLRTGVADFVHALEETMILTCRSLGVMANRNPINHGIWVESSKIGSIGLTIKKGVSFHGMALNVAMDLEPFSWINPCGLRNLTMTSIDKEINAARNCFRDPLLMSRAKQALLNHFSCLLQCRIDPEPNLEFIGGVSLP